MGKTTMEEVRRVMEWRERLTSNMVMLTRCQRKPLFLAILRVLYS
jgi:hypothetical protein